MCQCILYGCRHLCYIQMWFFFLFKTRSFITMLKCSFLLLLFHIRMSMTNFRGFCHVLWERNTFCKIFMLCSVCWFYEQQFCFCPQFSFQDQIRCERRGFFCFNSTFFWLFTIQITNCINSKHNDSNVPTY